MFSLFMVLDKELAKQRARLANHDPELLEQITSNVSNIKEAYLRLTQNHSM